MYNKGKDDPLRLIHADLLGTTPGQPGWLASPRLGVG